MLAARGVLISLCTAPKSATENGFYTNRTQKLQMVLAVLGVDSNKQRKDERIPGFF